MSERKIYWRRATDWGAILGMILISLEGIALAFKSSTLSSIVFSLIAELAIIAILWFSGRQNVYTAWSKPYNYGRSLGFVALTLMFAGVVRGVGFFVLSSWVNPDFYNNLLQQVLDAMMPVEDASESFREQIVEARGDFMHLMRTPFGWILLGVGSMLDLVLLFVPPIFLRQKQENNTINNE